MNMYFETNCKRCNSNDHCCIFENNSGFTFITPENAKRIKREIRQNYSYFLNYSPLSKKTINDLKNSDPALEGSLRYSQLDKYSRILRLKTKIDGRCIFLNDIGKCDIYKIRPNICKIFPFWAMKLTNGKYKVIEHDTNPRCSITKMITEKNEDIENTLSNKEILEIKKLFKNIEKENSLYKKNIQKFVKTI